MATFSVVIIAAKCMAITLKRHYIVQIIVLWQIHINKKESSVWLKINAYYSVKHNNIIHILYIKNFTFLS